MEFSVPDSVMYIAVKRCNTNSGMATHAWHSVDWDATEIKAFEEHIIRERIW